MEIAQVGARTRARTALAMEAASSAVRTRKTKRAKINNRNEAPKFKTASSAFVRLKSRTRTAAIAKTETVTVLPETETEKLSSDEELPASCCSSNGFNGLDKDRIKSLDLKVEECAQVETSTCNCGEELERREMSHSDELRDNSQELESMETNSRHPISTEQNIPTELELEEFFATAERDIQKRFKDKYNYDVVKDVPLEGRYQWVQLKP